MIAMLANPLLEVLLNQMEPVALGTPFLEIAAARFKHIEPPVLVT